MKPDPRRSLFLKMPLDLSLEGGDLAIQAVSLWNLKVGRGTGDQVVWTQIVGSSEGIGNPVV